MSSALNFFRSKALHLWAIGIALVLWLQVHGQGQGSLSMDIPLQVIGLPQDMVVVNDLPDTVRVTISGLQARLNELKPQDVHIPLDISGLEQPAVTERALNIADVRLPSGVSIEKIQPDRIELSVDRIVTREIAIQPRFDELPAEWNVVDISVTPAAVRLSGPEIWLDALVVVETEQVKPLMQAGPFELKVRVESPTGKAIRLVDKKAEVSVRGLLVPAAETGSKETK